MAGERIRLARDEVLTKLADVSPDPITKWAVEVHGRLYPVKEAFAAATGRRGFTSDTARRVFSRLEFRVTDAVEDQGRTADLNAREVARDSADFTRQEELRVVALNAAVRHAQGRPDMTVADVLGAADVFAQWLDR